MDISQLIRHRLKELGLEQKALAAAAGVTESYISQLLKRRKAPPSPGRTELYEKMGRFLRFHKGELSRLAALQRQEELKKKVEPARPLFPRCRELILRKCVPGRRLEVAKIIEKQPYGELERFVVQKLLEAARAAVQTVVRKPLCGEKWQRRMAGLRAALREFPNPDVFGVHIETLTPLIEAAVQGWDIDLKTFGMEVELGGAEVAGHRKRYEFVEVVPQSKAVMEVGLVKFLKDQHLSRDVSEEEVEFLKSLKFGAKRPSPLYYYREVQNLRDPLHFVATTRTIWNNAV